MSEPNGRTVAVVASLAESLINFRGPLLVELVQRKFRVVAFAPADANVEKRLRSLGIEMRAIPLRRTGMNALHDLMTIKRLRSEFVQLRPDIVFSYTIKPVLYGTIAAWLAKVPVIAVMITGLGYLFTESSWKRNLIRTGITPIYRFALSKTSGIFFQNTDDRDLFLASKIVSDKQTLTVIPGSGVDLNHYALAPLPSEVSFLMIARLVKDKGVMEYAAAAARLKQDFPEVKIFLCGPLDSNPSAIGQEELQRLVRDNTIDYLGELADVRPAIAESAVYVLPSYREGMPRTVLEAMSMGRPVITTDAPGCRDTVVDGVSGWIVPVRNADSLFDAMRRFVEDPDSIPSMGAAARQRAESVFDVDKVNAIIIDRLEEMVSSIDESQFQ